MVLNYRDRNWSFRFRLLELICCTALIILGILLLIKSELKLYIIIPVLVFGSAFTLICLYSFFGFGMQQSLDAFRSWIAFAAAGMALSFTTAGFLLVPTKFRYQSNFLHPTIALAFLTGIIFLLDMLFMIRHLHKHIFPDAPKETILIRPDIQSRSAEIQTGPPITVCDACKQPCQKLEECIMIPIEGDEIKVHICDYCNQRRQQGIECSSICPPQSDIDLKSTQTSLEPSIDSTQLIEREVICQPKIEAIPVQCSVPTCPAKPVKMGSICSAEECRARLFPNGDFTCDCKKRNIQRTKSIQVQPDSQPKILKLPCEPNICKKNVIQVTRSIQVTPDTMLSNKSSRDSSRIPLKICDRKKCQKSEESIETITSQKKDSYLKLMRAPKIAPVPPDISEIRTEQPNIKKSVKGKVCVCDSKNSTNADAREEIAQKMNTGSVYSNIPSYTKPETKPSSGKRNQTMKKSSSATIESVSTVSRNKGEENWEKEQLIHDYKTKTTVFTETPQIKTSEKNLQTTNKDSRTPSCCEPDRFGLKRSHTSMEIPEKKSKIPQLLQASHSIQTSSTLFKPEKIHTLDKTTSCKTYEPKVIEKEPIIIILKDYQPPCSQKRKEIVQISPPQSDQVKSIYPVKESPKDVSMQITDYFEKKKTPELKVSPILTPMEQEIVLSIHDRQMERNTQFSITTFCGCNDKTPSVEGICYNCGKKIHELEHQNQENTSRPLSRDSLLAQQPYAYSPKRNGLDEHRQASSPIVKYYSSKTTKGTYQDVRQPPQSAKIEQVKRDGLSAHGQKNRSHSLPASANYKKGK